MVIILLQARIHYPSRPRFVHLTPSRRRICRPLLRTNYSSFAIQCIRKNKTTKSAIIRVVGQLLKSEVAGICSDNFHSITRQNDKECVNDFDSVRKTLLSEMKSKAPTLFSLLTACLKTRKPRANTDTIVALIFSIMCKHRRPSACLFQRLISLILYSGHSSKQVRKLCIILFPYSFLQ